MSHTARAATREGMLEAYLSACKAANGERPREDLAGALGDSGGDGVFRLSSMSFRCVPRNRRGSLASRALA